MGYIAYKNLFDAVTDNPEESSELKTRSNLMIAIREIIKDQSWTEVKKNINLTQQQVCDLRKGKIEKFSLDLLMTSLFKIDSPSL